jgi:hypothetical protein
MFPLAALNVAEVAPAATVTEAGTVSTVLLVFSVTMAPPLGAPALKVTVHTALLVLLNVEGLHDTPVTVGKGVVPVTVPPVPDRVMLLPVPETAAVLLNAIEALLTPDANESVTTATVPFEILPAFMPDTRQVYAPEAATQLIVLDALVAAVPALAEMETTLLGGYVKVHCKAAGSLPAGDVKFRFTDIAPPVPTFADPNVKESVCPKAEDNDANRAIEIIRTILVQLSSVRDNLAHPKGI